jgi:hypothetical protein
MAFMERQIIKDTWLEVDTTQGITFIPADMLPGVVAVVPFALTNHPKVCGLPVGWLDEGENMSRPYSLTIANVGDYLALEWLSDRYETATLLYKYGQPPDDWGSGADEEYYPVTFTYTEPEAWQIQEAIELEDPPGVIPCASSSLMQAVHKMVDSIV